MLHISLVLLSPHPIIRPAVLAIQATEPSSPVVPNRSMAFLWTLQFHQHI
jgi:hypothetical protein